MHLRLCRGRKSYDLNFFDLNQPCFLIFKETVDLVGLQGNAGLKNSDPF